MRDFGPCLSPQNAWMFYRVLKLSQLDEKHCSNAEEWLNIY